MRILSCGDRRHLPRVGRFDCATSPRERLTHCTARVAMSVAGQEHQAGLRRKPMPAPVHARCPRSTTTRIGMGRDFGVARPVTSAGVASFHRISGHASPPTVGQGHWVHRWRRHRPGYRQHPRGPRAVGGSGRLGTRGHPSGKGGRSTTTRQDPRGRAAGVLPLSGLPGTGRRCGVRRFDRSCDAVLDP